MWYNTFRFSITKKMIELSLFMSNNVGLFDWKRSGLLNREIALYKELNKKGIKIKIFSYDRIKKIPKLPFKADIITQWPFIFFPKRFNFLYFSILPFVHFLKGIKTDIIMTNQAHMGWPALWASKVWKKPLIARSGYVFGEQAANLGLRGRRVFLRKFLERLIYKSADIVIVPTDELKDWLIKNYFISSKKIIVIPNYVDTELFVPSFNYIWKNKVIMVGRFDPVKRQEIVIKALAGTNIELILIGRGILKEYLKRVAKENKVKLYLIENIPNHELPYYFNQADIFIISSKWEGHPKALIEAMSCGLPCIGTNSPGIRSVMIDGVNGLLVDPVPEAILEAINKLRFDIELRRRLGFNARMFVCQNFSLGKIVLKYYNVITDLVR